MKDLKIVTVGELHSTIRSFIIDSKTIIGDYEDMKSLILTMIKAGYMFSMNRDRLRDAMEDLTFMLCPDDDANKDRVERGLEYEDDDDESDISDDDIDSYSPRRQNDPASQARQAQQERRVAQDDNNDETIEDIGNIGDLN